MSEDQYSTLNYIAHCRHGELGFNATQCTNCKDTQWYASSCGNRHCPQCLGPRQAQWSKRVCDRLPNCPHFHCVFTIPQELREFFRLNYRIAADILFAAAAETLKLFQKNNWGVKGGFFGVYHSWGSRLNRHPHLHVLVSAGGESLTTGDWKKVRPSYMFPVKSMSRVYGAIFLRMLQQQDNNSDIDWPKELATPCKRQLWRAKLAKSNWVVFNRPTLDSTRAVVRYLARYTSRIAISNSRILSADSETRKVTYQWTDYRNGGKRAECEVDGHQFIRAFSDHLVPKGFRRIRYYGFTCGSPERLRAISNAPAKPISENAPETEERQCECCGSTEWQTLMFRVRPFDTIPIGSEVKSFSLVVAQKANPPP